MNKILEINDFSCGYESKFNIEEINFSICKGSFVGIIGPNGSGKTTLFRGITGLLKAKSGKIDYKGKNLNLYKLKEKAQSIAIVTQKVEASYMTVEEYVLMGRLPYKGRFNFLDSKEDYKIAHKYMKLTDTFRYKYKFMTELSGGEQQLASIARALTQEPELLLLDEPTSHLDITHQVQLLNLIQKLNLELGLTVLMIIHDLNLGGEYCDYLIMLEDGRIHTTGKPENVLNYKNIEAVYKTVVVTETNPISGKPVVLLVSENVLKNGKKI